MVKKIFIVLSAVLVSGYFALAPILPTRADAVSDMTQGVKDFLLARGIAQCFAGKDGDDYMSFEDLKAGRWVFDNSNQLNKIGFDYTSFGYLDATQEVELDDNLPSGDPASKFSARWCGNMADRNNAAAFVMKEAGITTETQKREFFCSLVYGKKMSDCSDSDGEYHVFKVGVDKVVAGYEAATGRKVPNLTPIHMYWLAINSLKKQCRATIDIDGSKGYASNSENVITIPKVVDESNSTVKTNVLASLGKDSNNNYITGKNDVNLFGNPGGTTIRSETCQGVAKLVSDNADEYAAWASKQSNPPTSGAGDTGTGDGESTPTCQGGSFGWIICPAIEYLASATDFVASFLDGQLRTPILTTGGTNSELYGTWNNVRNVANVLFVIGFLIVIFSQATSIGLSSYGVKRLLPRIIVAAILVNISFFLCAIAVDISNIVGNSVAGFVNNLSSASSFNEAINGEGGFLEAVGSGVAIGGLLFVLFLILTPAVLTFIATFVVIAFRNALVVLLTIIAPVALVAWLLPNTEKYFKKWLNLFLGMLVLYPVIMFLFAAATLASNAVPSEDDVANIVKLIIMALPLFALPFLFKLSSGVLGKINDMSNRFSRPAVDKPSEFAKNAAKRGMRDAGARLASNDMRNSSNRFKRGLGKTGAFIGGFNARREFKQQSREASAKALQQEALAETVQGSDSFAKRAAGPGGEAAIIRAKAGAASTLDKMQTEELNNVTTLIAQDLRAQGMDAKTFSGNIRGILEAHARANGDMSDQRVQAAMGALKSPQLKGLIANQQGLNQQGLQAALNMAAAGGEISTLEAARANGKVDQSIVDNVISRNDGTVKAKGGYHLATNFDLAAGRGISGTDPDQATSAITKARIEGMANTSATDITNWKAGLLESTLKSIQQGNVPQSQAQVDKLRETLEKIVTTPTLAGNVSDNLEDMTRAINSLPRGRQQTGGDGTQPGSGNNQGYL